MKSTAYFRNIVVAWPLCQETFWVAILRIYTSCRVCVLPRMILVPIFQKRKRGKQCVTQSEYCCRIVNVKPSLIVWIREVLLRLNQFMCSLRVKRLMVKVWFVPQASTLQSSWKVLILSDWPIKINSLSVCQQRILVKNFRKKFASFPILFFYSAIYLVWSRTNIQ